VEDSASRGHASSPLAEALPRTYAPRLQQIADGVWIIESEPIKVGGGMPLPIRMSVIRLGSGDLLLHSPTQYTDDLKSAIEVVSKTGLPDPNVSCSTPF
jgi:hypothetical protein